MQTHPTDFDWPTDANSLWQHTEEKVSLYNQLRYDYSMGCKDRYPNPKNIYEGTGSGPESWRCKDACPYTELGYADPHKPEHIAASPCNPATGAGCKACDGPWNYASTCTISGTANGACEANANLACGKF